MSSCRSPSSGNRRKSSYLTTSFGARRHGVFPFHDPILNLTTSAIPAGFEATISLTTTLPSSLSEEKREERVCRGKAAVA